jgi:hypothetical protein
MTGKTGMTSTWSVTTKKFAMDFSQNKKDLNAERKKTALLEQRLREMDLQWLLEYFLPNPRHSKHLLNYYNPLLELSTYLPQIRTPIPRRY